MTDLLDPKNDYVFKRLFADAPNLLAALINAVLAPAAPVVVVSVRNPGIDPAELSGKYIVLDLLVEDSAGRQYHLEMQIRRYLAWSARSTYYLARLICGQLSAGDDYADLKPAIGIHFLDFDLFDAPTHADKAIWRFEMRDADRPVVLLGHELQLNLIELRKADRLGTPTGALADWIALFKHWNEEQAMSQIADDCVRAAREKLVSLSADKETRRLAFVRERALRDERTLLREAREEGVAEGEVRAMRAAAVNLVRSTSLEDSTIAAVTGLPVETVANLRQGASD